MLTEYVALETSSVKSGYLLRSDRGETYIDAVSNVSFKIYRNEIFGIAGESGSGKSTLIKTLYGYLEPPLVLKNGYIKLYCRDNNSFTITSLDQRTLRSKVYWKYISYIPQGSMNVLNPTMRIRDHFAEILKIHKGLEKKEAYIVSAEYLDKLGLPREVLGAFPHQLSGGMRQRVVIALSLLLQPDVVLADEPTTALDVINQRAALTMIRDLQRSLKNTVVLVTHDMGVMGVITHRMAIMYAGKIVEIGRTDEIFGEPLHPYTKALIESLPRIGDRRRREGLRGQPPDLRNPPPGCRFHPRCPYAMSICMKEEPPSVEAKPGHIASCWLHMKR